MTVAEYVRRLTDAIDTMPHAIKNAIDETGNVIALLNKEQLMDGNEKTGYQISPSYRTHKYARAKQSMNTRPPYGIPDLRLTGEFYRGFEVKTFVDRFEISSTDEKTNDLIDKYGEDIFGLNEENKVKYWNENLQPAIVRHIKGKL